MTFLTTAKEKRVNSKKDIARSTEWAKKNAEKVRANSAKYRTTEKYVVALLSKNLAKYGLSYSDYFAMLESQGNKCKICRSNGKDRKESPKKRVHQPLAIDHCHKTGKVRGLLCFKCNAGLGMFNDSAQLLTKAISYLMENEN